MDGDEIKYPVFDSLYILSVAGVAAVRLGDGPGQLRREDNLSSGTCVGQ